MTSKAESIAQAIVTALTVPAMSSVPAARVYRDLPDALANALFPAVVVELGDERDPQPVVIGYKDRFLDVSVTVLASAASNPFTAADAAVVESFNRMYADRTLGGLALDLIEGVTQRDNDGFAENVGAVRKFHTILYRTADGSLES